MGARIYRAQFDFEWVDCSDSQLMSEAVISICDGNKEYGTIVIDTISQYEDWAKEYIWSTARDWEISKQTGLLWGRTKDVVRQRILKLMRKAKVVVLTAHSRHEWVGNRPTGKLEAKALEPVWDLADLVAFLSREPNQQLPKGTVQPPYGKSRILALPPVIDPFTWPKLLDYMDKPANWGDLSPEEQAKDAYEILNRLAKIEEDLPDEG